MTNENLFELAKILPEPSILVESDGNILLANPSFLRIVAVAKNKLTGQDLSEISFTHKDKIDAYLRNCSRSRQMVLGYLDLRGPQGESVGFRSEGLVVEPAGENRPAKIFLRLKPKEVAGGKFSLLTQKIAELNKEIFERKRAERESHELYQQAKRSNRLKDEFLATLSHELRTPLNVILGWASLLRKKKLAGPDFDKALEIIERNAHSQTQLVEDLLDVSRIITGKVSLESEPVDIASVVERTVETIRLTAENKSIRLEVFIAPPAEVISGDAERLRQVLWNLLANAIKFTPKDGRIEVRLERINSDIQITVRDTGIGIEPEFLPFVFDRFRQADGSKTRQHGGLGLGLAIARYLIELHGGTIQASSAGKELGATFTLRLPIKGVPVSGAASFKPDTAEEVSTAQSDREKLEAQPLLENLSLLIVDDEPDTLEMMCVLLESYGAEVALSSTVAEAFEKLQNNNFDLLISDVEMPFEDGYSLIEKIRRADGNYKTIGAIALTAHARVTDRFDLLSAGFDSHIAKPFDPAELIATIIGLARRKKRF